MTEYRCLCGDPDCPSCGVAQGTYGGRPGAPPAKALFQVLPPDAGLFDAALYRKAVYLVLQAIRTVDRPTMKNLGRILQMEPTRVRRLLDVLNLDDAYKAARVRAGISTARARARERAKGIDREALD